jgi:prepilin-type processing-associated H-X9-DG protein
MWTEAIKNFATDGKGNVIFLDGSTEGMNKTLKEMMAMNTLESDNVISANAKKK